MKKINLNVKGMHCNSCNILVKEALMEVKGVNSADVDYKKGKAQVTYDEKSVKESDLIAAVKKEGYNATIGK